MKGQICGGQRAPLDISPEQFRSSGHALVDRLADLLATLSERKVTAGLSVGQIRDLIGATAGVPDDSCEFEPLLSQATELLTGYSLYNGHPKFLGYITSSPAPIGMLADLLAAAVNRNVGAWTCHR
jgi:aromatic-L-amino-acid/L-tryptophan decarboxylase